MILGMGDCLDVNNYCAKKNCSLRTDRHPTVAFFVGPQRRHVFVDWRHTRTVTRNKLGGETCRGRQPPLVAVYP